MKKYSCYDKNNKVILFQAAVITMLFHLALLYSFVYKPPINDPVKNIDKQIVMFNPVADSPDARKMARWLEYHNPGLIARPDYVYGYGAVSKRQKIRNPIKDIQPAGSEPAIVPPPSKFEFLSGGKKLKSDSNSRFVGYQTLAARSLARPVSINKTQLSYPLVKMSNGIYISKLLTVEDIKKHLPATTKKLGITRLHFSSAGIDMMPRIRVDRSCGITELDNLATRQLLINREKFVAKQPTDATYYVDIIWREVKR